MWFLSFLLAVSASGIVGSSSLCRADSSAVAWWQDQQVIQALNLTDEQQRVIEERVQQSWKRRAELTQQLAPLQHLISDLLSQPKLDEQKVLSALAAQLELRNARRREVVSTRLHVRQLLTDEQFRKLLTLNPRIMRQRWVKPRTRRLEDGKPSQTGSAELNGQDEKREDNDEAP